jgi:hypothetical protein
MASRIVLDKPAMSLSTYPLPTVSKRQGEAEVELAYFLVWSRKGCIEKTQIAFSPNKRFKVFGSYQAFM